MSDHQPFSQERSSLHETILAELEETRSEFFALSRLLAKPHTLLSHECAKESE